MKVKPVMTFLNGVCKQRLIPKETSIANCEVLDAGKALHRCSGGASVKVTDLLFAFTFCKKTNQENWSPRSFGCLPLAISINKFSEPSF